MKLKFPQKYVFGRLRLLSLNSTTTTKKTITASKCTKRLKVNPLLTFANSPWISFIPGQLGVGLSQTIF